MWNVPAHSSSNSIAHSVSLWRNRNATSCGPLLCPFRAFVAQFSFRCFISSSLINCVQRQAIKMRASKCVVEWFIVVLLWVGIVFIFIKMLECHRTAEAISIKIKFAQKIRVDVSAFLQGSSLFCSVASLSSERMLHSHLVGWGGRYMRDHLSINWLFINIFNDRNCHGKFSLALLLVIMKFPYIFIITSWEKAHSSAELISFTGARFFLHILLVFC